LTKKKAAFVSFGEVYRKSKSGIKKPELFSKFDYYIFSVIIIRLKLLFQREKPIQIISTQKISLKFYFQVFENLSLASVSKWSVS